MFPAGSRQFVFSLAVQRFLYGLDRSFAWASKELSMASKGLYTGLREGQQVNRNLLRPFGLVF